MKPKAPLVVVPRRPRPRKRLTQLVLFSLPDKGNLLSWSLSALTRLVGCSSPARRANVGQVAELDELCSHFFDESYWRTGPEARSSCMHLVVHQAAARQKEVAIAVRQGQEGHQPIHMDILRQFRIPLRGRYELSGSQEKIARRVPVHQPNYVGVAVARAQRGGLIVDVGRPARGTPQKSRECVSWRGVSIREKTATDTRMRRGASC
jgi:hypothetical protein